VSPDLILRPAKRASETVRSTFLKNSNDLARHCPAFLCMLYMLANDYRHSSVHRNPIAPGFSSSNAPLAETLLARWSDPAPSPISPPVAGLFFVVRLPSGWKCVAFRSDEFSGNPGHVDLWIGRHGLAACVAKQWETFLGRNTRFIFDELEQCCYGFPRGRVVENRKQYRIFHGEDFTRRMRISRSRVEHMFGISMPCKWRFDEHERCLRSDSAAVRLLLNLNETWPTCS